VLHSSASVAQLGERSTEDAKVTGSIPVGGIPFVDLTNFCGPKP
jgi:hypothetical protein